ncbi:hypothetical protein ACFL0W_05255 [Nanoarchaeota archaeon]
MSSKKVFLVFFIVISLLISQIGIVGAVTEDFNVYAQSEVLSGCACGVINNPITIENTGTVTSTYGLFQEGAASKWSILTKKELILKNGDKEGVGSFINVPCSARGEYDIKTTIQTLFDNVLEINQNIIINQCTNIQVIPVTNSLQSAPCKPLTYEFSITNTGTFIESYRISLEPKNEYNKYVTLSDNIVLLQPGESKSVFAYVNLPCDVYGQHGFEFYVEAESNALEAIVPFVVDILPEYDYEIHLEERYDGICQNTENTIQFKVSNEDEIANEYELSIIEAPKFVELLNESVALWGNQDGVLSLNVSTVDVEEGEYEVSIKSLSVRGDINKTITTTLSVENCYDISVELDVEEDNILTCETKTFTANVTNKGTRGGDIGIVLIGPEWAGIVIPNAKTIATNQNNTTSEDAEEQDEVDQIEFGKSMFLNGGQQKDLEITVGNPCDEFDDYEIGIVVGLVSYPDVEAEDYLELEVIDMVKGYDSVIKAPNKIKTDYNGTVETITIQNNGIRDIEYDLTVAGSPIGQLNQTTITIPQKQERDVSLIITPAQNLEEGEYAISIDAEPEKSGILFTKEIVVSVGESQNIGLGTILVISIIPLVLAILILLSILLIKKRKKRKPLVEKESEKPGKKRSKTEELSYLIKTEPLLRKKTDYGKPLKIAGLLILLGLIVCGIGALIYFSDDVIEGLGINGTISSWLNQTKQPSNQTDLPAVPEIVEEDQEEVQEVQDRSIYLGEEEGLFEKENTVKLKNEPVIVPLMITNRNKEETEFKIRTTDSVDWIEATPQTLKLKPGREGKVLLNITPKESLEEGLYEVMVKVETEKDGKREFKQVDFKIDKSRGFFREYLWFFVGGMIVTGITLFGVERKLRKKKRK